ncbi:MAG: redox-sensing transcriptional repressor Rex [Armatimonadota bacterium]|nr:redox-sensing transcriptional repressor Rex [bacterium]
MTKENKMSHGTKVPMPTLERLATYLTVLTDLKMRNVETISSADIETRTGVNAAQFRKDLSYFGEFGKPGIGYDVQELHSRISKILNLENRQPVLLMGAGNLGSALAGYQPLRAENFQIVAAFDNNPAKIGTQLWDLTIKDIATIEEENKLLGARMGIIAVPAAAAQDAADRLVKAKVVTILNFAPVLLKLPPTVTVRNVDFVQELAVLAFHLPDSG